MSLSLRINIVERNVKKTINFDPSTAVYDACKIIREKCAEEFEREPKDYGLFLTDTDNKTGVWLEPARYLEYYLLRNGDILEYRKKMRTLRVKMLDGSVKTMLVDDSQVVANLMVVICTKIGITNHDEYSLVLEDQLDQENNPDNRNYGTLTLKRKKEEKDRDTKMDQLRKKIRTDDEVNWVDPSKTLREQGIDENETVLLRRKFFFSDQNIDSRDPIQLNLLYVQARDAILDGTHPVTNDKACEFAGIQCQIQFGDHSDTKHKAGLLDLKDFLPASYHKVKGIEKKVFAEHRKNFGSNELDAKVLYTKTARDLKTYGVSFFLVKEKMSGKNKLVPRLLGVTKDSILRLDEITKEILQTWPLTQVRRWGASPNTFTLDFGDYSDQYYSVRTMDGEQIQQIIAGYIDIILKKKQAKDHLGIEGDEGSTMVEDSVSPHKATILQHESTKLAKVNTESLATPAVLRAGTEGMKPYGTGHVGGAQFTTVSGQANVAHQVPLVQQTKVTSVLSEPQQALLSTIHETQYKIKQIKLVQETMPEIGSDPAAKKWKQVTLDTRKHYVGSQIAAMNAATAQVVTLTSGPPDEVDHVAVEAAITTIGSNLPEMTDDVRMIAALMDDTNMGDKLLDATRRLVSAFSDLLKAAEPESKEPRQTLLSAASRVGEASKQVLETISDDTPENKELHDILLSLAKAVANSTAALILKAKNIAANCDDQQTQNRVIGAATQCALVTSQLVACAKLLAPTLHAPACQEQITAAVREVAKAVDNLVQVCNDSYKHDDELMHKLRDAAAEVTRTLSDMLNHIKFAASSPKRATESTEESNVEVICTTTDKLLAASGDSGEMVKQARILGQATAQLIQSIKGEAERQPENSDLQRRLLAAAKTLADATARMVEAARQCGTHPQDAKYQDKLLHSAEYLRDVTMVATSTTLRAKLVDRVNVCARRAVATATQCVSAAHASYPHNTNDSTKEHLMEDSQELAHQIPPLVDSIKMNTSIPENDNNQVQLMYVAEVFLHPATTFIQSSRAALPTLTNQSVSQQLSSTTQQLNTDLTELRSAISSAQPACHGLGLTAAGQLIEDLQEELRDVERAVENHTLKPLPGDSASLGTQHLSTTARRIPQSIAQLLSSITQSNHHYTTQAAHSTAQALRTLTHSIRTIAATTDNEQERHELIDAGKGVLLHSARLVGEAIRVWQVGESGGLEGMRAEAGQVGRWLERTVGCMPGQRDVDMAVALVGEWSNTIEQGRFPSTNKSYADLNADLNQAAAHLNEAGADVVMSAANPVQLASSSKEFSSAFHELLQVSMEMTGQTQDEQMRGQMVQSLRHVATVSSGVLVTAKGYGADQSAPNAKNELTSAARSLTDTINQHLLLYTNTSSGQAECDNAVRRLRALKPMLDAPSERVNEAGYYDCLDAITERSRELGDGLIGMKTGAERGEMGQFKAGVRVVADCVAALVEGAAQSAYLVGIADNTSTPHRPGLLDPALLARAAHGIRHACSTLTSPQTVHHAAIYDAVQQFADHTSALCRHCRTAAERTANPVAKRQFAQGARDVAGATSDVVAAIKAGNMDRAEDRGRLGEVVRPMLATVDNVCLYASSSEFASVPAKISPKGRQAQQPIVDAGRSVIDSTCSVITSVKSLAAMPRDPPIWQQFAAHSKQVSDSIKRLVDSIKDKAPGQSQSSHALHTLTAHLHTLNTATMDAVQQRLAKHTAASTAASSGEQVTRAASELLLTLGPLQQATKSDVAGQLGHHVDQLVAYFDPLVAGSVASASHMTNSKQQEMLLCQARSVTESARELVGVVKDCGGNPKASELHPELDEAANSTRDALRDLVRNLETLSAQSGAISGAIDGLTRSMTRLNDNRASLILTDGSFVEYQTSIVDCAKDIAKLAGEMSNKAVTEPKRLPQLSSDLSQRYGQLSADTIGASAVSTNGEVAALLKESVQSLGGACIELVKAGGDCTVRRDDVSIQNIHECSRAVIEKISRVLATLHASSRGTQACINAACTVSGIIGDLDTTIMFATAGNLNPEHENESFADHRENILKTAKALVEDTKTLVTGAASTQENLAVAAQNAVTTIVQLAEVVKFGAASLGSDNSDSQVMLINAVKDVASALGDLIHATKAASGKPINDPAMTHLRDTSKVMVTNVTSLLKTVKSVENEHARGTRALESAIEAIGQALRANHLRDGAKENVTPEDLVRCTKAITQATAKSVSAGISNKQGDIMHAANLSRGAISDMLVICKSAAFYLAETPDLHQRTLAAGHTCTRHYLDLLNAILNTTSTSSPDAKQTLPLLSRRIAQSVTEIVAVAELVKGSDWEDPDDPTVIAENELLGAAASIDAAAKKLASLRPRVQKVPNELDESMNFDEMILEAAKSIAAATSALVKAASAAQRELIDSGKVSRTPLTSSDDGQWSEGLISAARMVAAATHSLVESANNLVQGVASEEKLISSAKQVASSTAHLLVACKVKAEANTDATRRLQQAGNAVIRSTDNLVRAAQRAISIEEERSLVLNKRMVGGIAQEINARSEVLRMERQLEEARGRLIAIRQAKYKLRGEGGTTSGEDTDGEGLREYDSALHSRYDQNYDKYTGYAYDSSDGQCNEFNTNNKQLTSHINTLDSAVYGGTNTYNQNTALYGSISKNGGNIYTQDPDIHSAPISPYAQTTRLQKDSPPRQSVPKESKSPTNTFGKPYTPTQNVTPKAFTGDTAKTTTTTLGTSAAYPDGYTTKESSTNTFKIPGGYKTVTNKYESYHGSSEPLSYTTSEKYYTSSPTTAFDTKSSLFTKTFDDNAKSFQQTFADDNAKSFQPYVKNGGNSDYQQSYSSTMEVVNEPAVVKDNDTLEQKMLKKSVTQQVSEKKTVQVIRSSKQESSNKTFKFE